MNSREIALFSTAAVLGAVSSAVVFSHFLKFRLRELKNRCSQNGVVGKKPSRLNPFDPENRKGYLSWDDYFMAIAFLSAERSKDPNRQVGACLVSEKGIILGIGYNGFPRGCSDDKLPWSKKSKSGDPLETKYPYTYACHAEVNAILNTNHASAAGQRLYVTMFPCNECAKIIIQSGVSEVYYVEKRLDNTDAAYVASHKLLSMAGIKMKKAIELFTEDPKYKKGWKFHHVWSTIGDFEKFKDCSKGSKKKMRNHNSSASENEIPDPQDSQGMSSFSMNLGDDDDDNYEISGSSSRPIGQKKAKNKAKKDEATASLISKLRSDNKQFLEEMKTSNELFKEQMEKKNAFREMKEENKILFQDSSLIQDPRYRAFVESEQARILQKRAQQSSQPDPFATGSYSAYFNNLGGSSSDIPPY